jgi:hypothetical protein
MVFDAHDRAFALFKGTCSRCIYDNTKTAVETIRPSLVMSDIVTAKPALQKNRPFRDARQFLRAAEKANPLE